MMGQSWLKRAIAGEFSISPGGSNSSDSGEIVLEPGGDDNTIVISGGSDSGEVIVTEDVLHPETSIQYPERGEDQEDSDTQPGISSRVVDRPWLEQIEPRVELTLGDEEDDEDDDEQSSESRAEASQEGDSSEEESDGSGQAGDAGTPNPMNDDTGGPPLYFVTEGRTGPDEMDAIESGTSIPICMK